MAGLQYENSLREQGYTYIVGCDEAGRGPLAGPVVVAAVILPLDYDHPEIDDSKKLTDRKRRILFEQIKRDALDYAIIIIDAESIDRQNIYQASKQGMMQAVLSLTHHYDAILTDAMPLEGFQVPVVDLIHGDALSQTIASASILAKVTRDNLMIDYDLIYPQYGFAKHKGYGTKQHLEALSKYGPCVLHRKSFAPVADVLREQLPLFEQETVGTK